MSHPVIALQKAENKSRPTRQWLSRDLLGALSFTVLGFLVMGYHPGLEDDGVYLSAVKARLNPALFPFDARFFKLQMQATIFDGFIAHFVRWTGMPLAWAELFWQFVSLFLILLATRKILNLLFRDAAARWAGVALVAAMFTLPVSGAALYMADQHLHPRNLAAALILLAVWRVLAGDRWQAIPLLVFAFAMHPIMGAFGVSFCLFLVLTPLVPARLRLRALGSSSAVFMPLGWIFEPAGPTWLKATETRHFFFLYQWTWYEWLGALAPLVFFALLWRFARKRGETQLARFASAVLFYGVFQQAFAMVLLAPFAPARLEPLQPMRYLQLEYFLFAMTGGAMLGRYLLKMAAWRWAVFLLAVNGGMFLSQRLELSDVQHIELPGRQPANPWLQAFAWIRVNTPVNAYFALDPHYLEAPGEDFHSFRALAERSQLADAVKDAAVVTQVPDLGPIWNRQVVAQQGWRNFQLADFERLKSTFGVNWALVSYPQPRGLLCRWHNDSLAVCQIP